MPLNSQRRRVFQDKSVFAFRRQNLMVWNIRQKYTITKENNVDTIVLNKELASFILQWRWEFKHKYIKVGKAKMRTLIANKFNESKEHKDATWTTEMFCQTYEKLLAKKMI